MDTLAQILPQLGVGALSLLVLGYLSKLHAEKMEKKDKIFLETLHERETAFRGLEKEMRVGLLTQLSENTAALKQNVAHFNRHE